MHLSSSFRNLACFFAYAETFLRHDGIIKFCCKFYVHSFVLKYHNLVLLLDIVEYISSSFVYRRLPFSVVCICVCRILEPHAREGPAVVNCEFSVQTREPRERAARNMYNINRHNKQELEHSSLPLSFYASHCHNLSLGGNTVFTCLLQVNHFLTPIQAFPYILKTRRDKAWTWREKCSWLNWYFLCNYYLTWAKIKNLPEVYPNRLMFVVMLM